MQFASKCKSGVQALCAVLGFFLYEKSFLARLNYVHQNAVKHGLAPVANAYPWCSAAWFERTATPAQVKTVYGLKTDRIHVIDDF